MLNEFRFIKGEQRRITYLIRSKTDRNFCIENCNATIFHENEMIAELETETNGHEIHFVIDTEILEYGYYTVIMTLRINEEVVKKKMSFEVTDYV